VIPIRFKSDIFKIRATTTRFYLSIL